MIVSSDVSVLRAVRVRLVNLYDWLCSLEYVPSHGYFFTSIDISYLINSISRCVDDIDYSIDEYPEATRA